MDVTSSFTNEWVHRRIIPELSRQLARRYARYGVSASDCLNEMTIWALGSGERHVKRWLASSPQQITRLTRELTAQAQIYCEKEKANSVGYDIDDVAWYSPATVQGLLPLVFDSTFDGTGVLDIDSYDSGRAKKTKSADEHSMDLTVMVVDIRRAIASQPAWVELTLREGPDDGSYTDGVGAVIDFLGGTRPNVIGKPRISNVAAQHLVSDI